MRKTSWMIRGISVFLILLAGMWMPIRADVIMEPEDPFFQEHAEECTYVGRFYRVNAAEGTLLYTAPQSKEILGQVPLGEEIWIDFVYFSETEGSWGVQALTGDLSGSSVWLNLADLQSEMNEADFLKEHQAEMEPLDEMFAPASFSGYLCFYAYPGADSVYEYTDAASILEDPIQVSWQFTAKSGEVWLYTSYYFGHHGWFQREQPIVEQAPLLDYQHGMIQASEDGILQAAPPMTPSPIVLTPEPDRTADPKDRGSVRPYLAFSPSSESLIGGLVLVVVLVTGGLIAVFWKKQKP